MTNLSMKKLFNDQSSFKIEKKSCIQRLRDHAISEHKNGDFGGGENSNSGDGKKSKFRGREKFKFRGREKFKFRGWREI